MVKVQVTVNGGLSVLSAFANGYGSAVSIELPMTVVIERKNSTFSQRQKTVLKTMQFLTDEFGIGKNYDVSVSNSIPSGKGFKSSSALTLSLIKGILELEKMKITGDELLKLSVEASLYNRTSVTGGLDDLCSCLYGGFCLTDNINRKIVDRKTMESGNLLIAYSKMSRRTFSLKKLNFSLYKKKADGILRMIEKNRIFDAMETNGYLFGSIFGTDRKVIQYFFSAGATHSSISGKGPGIFGIFDTEAEREKALKNFPYSSQYEILRTSFSNKGLQLEYV